MTGELPFPAAETGRPTPPPQETAPRPKAKGRVFLLDGTALAYRSHFALLQRPLLTSRGQNVSALYVFANTLFRILEKERPDYLAVAFDPPGPTFRHARYEDYKATRQKTPDELIDMLPAIRRLVEGFRAPIVEIEGYEADDVIATLARAAEAAGHEVFIVTGDKDFLQIVSPRVKLYNILRQDSDVEIQGVEAARAKFGVDPERVIDVLALMGDSSDNVPGVAGVGPKTASELVQTFGSLDALYARLDEVAKPALRKKLEAARDVAYLSRELVTFDLAAPVAFDPEAFRCQGPDGAALLPLFREYEMESLTRRIPVDNAGDVHEWVVVRDRERWERFLAKLAEARSFVFDTETDGLDPLRARLVGIAISFCEREAFYLPVNLDPPLFGDGRPDLEHFAAALRGPFADPAVAKRAQNAKFDLLVLERHGLPVEGIDFDTMIASYCVAPGDLQHNLDALALKYLNYRKVATTDLIGRGKAQITMAEVEVDKCGNYACEDVDMTCRLVPILQREMEEIGVLPLFREVEMPLMRVLADMERAGVKVDVEMLRAYSGELETRVAALTRELYELAGEEFNLNSPRQLGPILFEKLEVQKCVAGNKRPKKTKTGWSTDAAVLETYREHPFCARLLAYRSLVKLKGTYVDALPELVNPDTGRIHTSFNQAVAATGRLSSSDPNLQNIPIRTEEGRRIRRAFVAEPGHRLLAADYSQVELRILAHLSGDENLRKAFRDGIDVHRWTASLIFGMPPSEVPPELRNRAKTINFGVVYGMGAPRLAGETGMTVGEAAKFIEAYFQTFAGVKRLLDETLERAHRDGYVTTLLGRRRQLPDLDSPHPRVAAAMRNMAVNTPIQGTAADLIKVAMVRLHERLRTRGLRSRMILQVHDELLLEVPEAELDAARALVAETMEGALELSVPLVVEIGVADNWLDAHG